MSDVSELIRWLASMPKSAWPVLAAVAASSGLAVWLGSDLPIHLAGIAWIGLLAACLLFFYSADAAFGAWKGRLRRKFSQLSEHQKSLLLSAYIGGSRFVTGPIRPGNNEWFIELEDWNYVKLATVSVIKGKPGSYAITKNGWRELQKYQNKSRRPTEQ